MAVSPPHEMSPNVIHSDLEAALWANAPEVPGMEPNYIPDQLDQTMRVLVTGASGSGGSYMAEYAKEQGAEVHGLARWHTSPLPKDKPGYTVHECDLMDMGSIYRVLDQVRPHVIFHLASHANVRACFDTPIAVLQNNILGTANLLEAIRTLGLKLQTRFVMCSSSEVYGQVPASYEMFGIDENCPLNPVSPYAVSKLAQDSLSHAYHKSFGLDVVCTRMFTYLNPRRADLFATSFAMQVARIEAGKQTVLKHGNLDSVRTVLDVRDAVRAYWLAAMKGIPGEVYNIGGTETVTVGSFLETLKSLATCPIPSEPDPALMRPADVTLQVPDCSRFIARTGWKPQIPFTESVKFLLEHCRDVVSR
jgi:GDP-4-dehydro-6-deoxy-D-mannose reductase